MKIAKKSKSKIQKGKRFADFVNREIEAEGLGRAIRTPGSGSGNRFKGDSFNSLDFLLEYKNQNTIKIQEWIRQAKEQARIGNYNPDKWALIFRDPHSPEANPECYAVIDMWQFLKLLKKNQAPKIKEPDRTLRWKLERLKDSINQVLKELK